MNYRNDARESLKRAERELGSADDQRLRYAALELRMAMEALTYDRAIAYKDEFPPDEYETWQPRKVMAVLLNIDPRADRDCSLAFGIQENQGVPASVMTPLGSEKVLNMAALREHYDALGSYLHLPSLKQARAGKPQDFAKLRSRCEEIAALVGKVLSSPVFNVTVGNVAILECQRCGKRIRKRIPHGHSEVRAECYECHASYTLVDKENGEVEWKPQQHELKCANKDCQRTIFVWHYEIQRGACWICTGCTGRNTIDLAIIYEPEGSYGDASPTKG
jgi:hypothetical protein